MKKALTLLLPIIALFLIYAVLLPSGAFATAAPVSEPKDWLSDLSGTGVIDPAKINVRTNIVPFVINLVIVALFVTSLIFIVIGGIKWIMSGGAKDGVAKAKGTITYAVIGLALALCSFVIFGVMQYFLGAQVF